MVSAEQGLPSSRTLQCPLVQCMFSTGKGGRSVEDRGKECIKHLCCVPVPVCQVTIHILEGDNVTSPMFLSMNIFKTTLFIGPHISGHLPLQLSFHCTKVLPTVARNISVEGMRRRCLSKLSVGLMVDKARY